MTVLDSHQARQALVQYTGKKVLARSDGMRVNEMFIILALLVMPIWQTFCVVAAASDVKQPDIRIPPEASVELEPVSALSILPNTPNNDSKSLVQILELNLARAEFDDETFAGNINLWGFTLALGLDSRYEIGYSYLTNTHLYGDWEPSLDEGPELASYEDFDISSKLIYLRRNWLIEDRLGVFALVGYSKVEIETHLIEACFFVCGELIKVSEGEITYANQQSGLGWGVGIQWQIGRFGAWTLRYVDQSRGDFEFRSIRLDLSIRG
jgi:hypothetical protein